jgi:hypothetical protein
MSATTSRSTSIAAIPIYDSTASALNTAIMKEFIQSELGFFLITLTPPASSHSTIAADQQCSMAFARGFLRSLLGVPNAVDPVHLTLRQRTEPWHLFRIDPSPHVRRRIEGGSSVWWPPSPFLGFHCSQETGIELLNLDNELGVVRKSSRFFFTGQHPDLSARVTRGISRMIFKLTQMTAGLVCLRI